MSVDVAKYLDRIGYTDEVRMDLATLAALQRAHMTAVAFENLHVFHRLGVPVDVQTSVAKIVDQRRGGWCFELNGAFSELLMALGFDVMRLGAAVLLGGPNETIDHMAIEVELDQAYLVDVGFGDCFIEPLRINVAGPQDGGTGTFELIQSPQGLTLAEHEDTGIAAVYRFKRVNHQMSDFEPASQHLQTDPELKWRQKPFATRLIDGGPDRVTLLSDRIKFRLAGELTEQPVEPDGWEALLQEWFAMDVPA